MTATEFFRQFGLKVTSLFGPRIHPITGKKSNHNGIDFGGKPTGTPVHTPTGGIVTHSKHYSGYGHLVAVQDPAGQRHLFAHLDSRLVAIGDRVSRGDTIGKLGNTGRSTGPHLHYQINKPSGGINGKGFWGNPDDYIFWEDRMDIILLNTQFDSQAGFWLHQRTGAAIAIRGAGDKLLPLAKTIYIVGGEADSVHRLAPQATLIHLAGRNQQGTMRTVLDFLHEA